MDKNTRDFFDSILNEEPYSPDPESALTLKQFLTAIKNPENWGGIGAKLSKQIKKVKLLSMLSQKMLSLNETLWKSIRFLNVVFKSRFNKLIKSPEVPKEEASLPPLVEKPIITKPIVEKPVVTTEPKIESVSESIPEKKEEDIAIADITKSSATEDKKEKRKAVKKTSSPKEKKNKKG